MVKRCFPQKLGYTISLSSGSNYTYDCLKPLFQDLQTKSQEREKSTEQGVWDHDISSATINNIAVGS